MKLDLSMLGVASEVNEEQKKSHAVYACSKVHNPVLVGIVK